MPLDPNRDIEIRAGRSLDIRVPILNQDGTIPDLAGKTVKWAMGRNACVATGDISIVKTSSDGIAAESQAGIGAVVTIRLDADDTADLEPGNYFHEGAVFDGDGGSADFISGRFILKPSLIREP